MADPFGLETEPHKERTSFTIEANTVPRQHRCKTRLEVHATPSRRGRRSPKTPRRQNSRRSESCKLRSPCPDVPLPLERTLPKVWVLVGLRPILVVPLQPLLAHQFGWFHTL